MNIQELSQLYAHMPQVAALAKVMGDKKSRNIFLDGLLRQFDHQMQCKNPLYYAGCG